MISTEYLAGFFDGEGCIGVYTGRCQGGVGFGLRTQLTQNVSVQSMGLLSELMERFGGNGSTMCRSRSRPAYNWQLNGDRAAHFLEMISPHLLLKREQADIAIAWQRQRPPRVRNARGHIVFKHDPVIEFDRQVSEIVRELKQATLEVVLSQRPELKETAHVLLHGLRSRVPSTATWLAGLPTQMTLWRESESARNRGSELMHEG